MTRNAAVSIDKDKNLRVIAFKEVRCPACGKCLFEHSGKANVRDYCDRCKALVELTPTGEVKLISRPKRIDGNLRYR